MTSNYVDNVKGVSDELYGWILTYRVFVSAGLIDLISLINPVYAKSLSMTFKQTSERMDNPVSLLFIARRGHTWSSRTRHPIDALA